jgi:phosphomevalonate kinase
MKLRAPGKVFLAGEYAVLEGRPALVCGVDRFLEATVAPAERLTLKHAPSGIVWDGGPAPEELRFAVRAVELSQPPKPFRLTFENDFAVDGRKLGLGGSAASTVLAVRASRPELDERDQLKLAVNAHWLEQAKSGSGADVAACAFGGVLEVSTRMNPEPQLAVRRVPVPARLRLLLAFTGRSADTRSLVKKARGLPTQAISAACESLTQALTNSDEEAALQAVRDGAAAMAALGEAAGAPIVTAELMRIAAIAASAGAAAKPSGAGGGDCAVIFCFGEEVLQRAEAALRAEFVTFRVSPA